MSQKECRNGPFDLDQIFARIIERFDDAWQRRVEKHGIPVANIDDPARDTPARRPAPVNPPVLLRAMGWIA
jgi:hypothetical protein